MIIQDNSILKNNPLVSVVVITYNQENYIKQTIDSILEQETDFDYEIIIGDDCSKDNTVKIIAQYFEKVPVIKLIKNESNIGHQLNLLNVINHCKGRFVAICAGDDYWISKSKLANQSVFLSNNKDFNLIYSNCYIHYESEFSPSFEKLLYYDKDIIFDLHDYLGQKYMTVAPTMMFRKDALPEFNLKNYKKIIIEDEFLFALILKNGGKAFYSNKTEACYRITNVGLNSGQPAHVQLFNKLLTLHYLISEFEIKSNERIIIRNQIKLNIDRLFNYSFESKYKPSRISTLILILKYDMSILFDYRFYYNWIMKPIMKYLKIRT